MKNPLNFDYVFGLMLGTVVGFAMLDSWRDVVLSEVLIVAIAITFAVLRHVWVRQGRRA